VAHVQDLARPAERRKAVSLGQPEGAKGRAFDEVDERLIPDIAEPMGLVDIVIAGEDVAVALEDGDVAADGPEEAERMLLAEGGPGGLLEDLDLDAPDIARDPFVEDGAEERSPGLGRDGIRAGAAGGPGGRSTSGRKVTCAALISRKKP